MARCTPLFYPFPGDEDTYAHDHSKHGRYFVVGEGCCGTGVFTDPMRANEQTDGYSGFVKRSCKKWDGPEGVVDTVANLCRQHHTDGCPPISLPAGFTATTPVMRRPASPPPLATVASLTAAAASLTARAADGAPAPVAAAGSTLFAPAIIITGPLTPPSPRALWLPPPSPLSPDLHIHQYGRPCERTPTLSSINNGVSTPSSTTSSVLTDISDLFSPNEHYRTSPSVCTAIHGSALPSLCVFAGGAQHPTATLSQVEAPGQGWTEVDDGDDENDENDFQALYWIVVGLRRRVYSTLANAICAAEEAGMGACFTLMSSTDIGDLENSQDLAFAQQQALQASPSSLLPLPV
ncbi:hypothetical protein C8R45DRAFT_1106436 [Mycena sanguinolenta]|nr:hypothetical protein C8R45DRAFT_1106436 [Mycena sanguinolenta]